MNTVASRRFRQCTVAFVLALAGGVFESREALAEDAPTQGAFVGAQAQAQLTSTSSSFEGGPGLRLEGGYAINLHPVFIAPQLVVDVNGLFGDFTALDLHVMGGCKVGADLPGLSPFGFADLGYGLFRASQLGQVAHGVSFDVGGGVDHHLTSHLTIGGLLGYRGVVYPSDHFSSHGVELAGRIDYYF